MAQWCGRRVGVRAAIKAIWATSMVVAEMGTRKMVEQQQMVMFVSIIFFFFFTTLTYAALFLFFFLLFRYFYLAFRLRE